MTSRPPMKASILLATLRLSERPGPHCIEWHYGTFQDAMVRKQSNKRSGARLKTDSKTEERCVKQLLRYAKPILRKKDACFAVYCHMKFIQILYCHHLWCDEATIHPRQFLLVLHNYYLDTSGNFPLNHEDTWFQPPETERSKLYKPTILLDIIMIVWKTSIFLDKKNQLNTTSIVFFLVPFNCEWNHYNK